MNQQVHVGIVVTLIALCGGDRMRAGDYASDRSAAVSACAAIDAAAYQSGLLMNPDGYRSFYLRSECYQKVAVGFRDDALCAQVRQRRSLFSSSWGYSPAQCRKLVAEGLASDRAELEGVRRLYLASPIRLRDFRIVPNGNGRDFDIIPTFSGGYAHGHTVTFEILDAGAPVLVHASGYYLDAGSNLRIYVRQSDIRARLASFSVGRPYQVRATVLLDIGTGGLAGRWSHAFIDRVFPVRERTQSLTLRTAFQN